MAADIYIGIDPGVNGGIAALSAGGTVLEVWKMPGSVSDLVDVLLSLRERTYTEGDRVFAYLEKVHSGAFRAQGARMGVKSAFTFGQGLGRLEGVLAGVRIPYEDVLPARWQKSLGCLTHGDKKVSYRHAQKLFPQVKVTYAIADALLIAEYGRRRGF